MFEARFMVDARVLEAASRMLDDIPKGLDKACMRTVNRAANKGKVLWGRAVNADYTVKIGDVKGHIAVRRANKNQDHAEVVARPKRFELVDFAHQPRTPFSQLKRKPVGGLGVNVKRSTGRLKVAGAFKVIGTSSGKEHIVWRKREGGKAVHRYPLHILYGPRLTDMALATLPNIEGEMQVFIRERFQHEVRAVLAGYDLKKRRA